MATTRRLAAIMFTDLVGFTAATQANEAEALKQLRAQERVIRPLLGRYHGREVKSTGDGLLVEFSSARSATDCAVAIQRKLGQRASASGRGPMPLRIGIHVGDIEESDGDVFGDTVNVASRIVAAADPGGVCVSGQVFDHLRNKVGYPMTPLETRKLKGVNAPLALYRVVLPWVTGPTPSQGAPSTGATAAEPSGPDPERIVVLPFTNISPDPADEYFADGMTEELIEKLAHAPGLRVIARTTAMHYKHSHETTLEIGRALRVGKVVECSVRKAGRRLRITAQLVDTASEEHLWAARYDRELDDVFAIQDDIANEISKAVSARLARPVAVPRSPGRPREKETEDMEAYTLYLHGRKLLSEKRSEESIGQAREFFRGAVARDPRFSRARVGLAEATLWLGGEGAIPFREAVDRSRADLERAIAEDETLAEAHAGLAGVLVGEDEITAAEREALRAVELNPSLSEGYRWLAQISSTRHGMDEAVHWLETAQQVDPVNIDILAFLGRAYAYSGREREALAHWERTKVLVPFRTCHHQSEFYLAKGDFARARGAVEEMERLRPSSPWALAYRAMLAARTGDPARARAVLSQLVEREKKGELMVFFIGFVHYALGETEAFVESMQRAFAMHSLPFLELRYSALFEPARSDPRIRKLLREQGEMG